MKKFDYKKWLVGHKHGKTINDALNANKTKNKTRKIINEQVFDSKGERLSGIALANLRSLESLKNHSSVTFKGDASYEDRTFQKQADNEDADKFVFRNEKGVIVSPEDLAQYQFGGAKSGKLMNNPLKEIGKNDFEDKETTHNQDKMKDISEEDSDHVWLMRYHADGDRSKQAVDAYERSQNKNEHHEGGALAAKLKGMSAFDLLDFIESNSKMQCDNLEMALEDWWDLDDELAARADAEADAFREETMSPEEWADAKEAERLANHPEKDKINKIKQMMDKEKAPKITGMEDDPRKDYTDDEWEDHYLDADIPEGMRDSDVLKNKVKDDKERTFKKIANELGYLDNEER